MPTELHDATGERIRERGREFGTTTGRPRRVGWLDLVALRYACMINGVSEVAIMLLDVLAGFDTLRLCTAYEIDGVRTDRFTPDAEELLGSLVPAAVKAVLFQIFNDAIVSEHVARMVAMKAATDNAGKMGKSLKTQFNRARQAQITTELTEIVSGAAALG